MKVTVVMANVQWRSNISGGLPTYNRGHKMTFWIINTLCSVYCIWRVIVMMSWQGRVDNGGRFFILISFVPILSVIMAVSLILIEGLFFLGGKFDKWWSSPKMVTWRTLRKIRKRRRGPIVRIVEHMHKKREEKANEADVSED